MGTSKKAAVTEAEGKKSDAEELRIKAAGTLQAKEGASGNADSTYASSKQVAENARKTATDDESEAATDQANCHVAVTAAENAKRAADDAQANADKEAADIQAEINTVQTNLATQTSLVTPALPTKNTDTTAFNQVNTDYQAASLKLTLATRQKEIDISEVAKKKKELDDEQAALVDVEETLQNKKDALTALQNASPQ